MTVFQAYHDSHALFYRKPFGAVICGQRITFRLQTSSAAPVESCVLRIWENNQEVAVFMHQTDENNSASAGELISDPLEYHNVFAGDYEAPDRPGLVWYYFVIRTESQTHYYGNNPQRLGGEGGLWGQEPPSYQITVYKWEKVPQWYKRGIMYQIFVDRFYCVPQDGAAIYPRKKALLHANWSDPPIYIKDEQGRVTDWDFFGGNLQGVIHKLPYLQELGVTILYLNPIFDAPSNHKYDTADYHRIDPMYGDEAVFERLINSAKQYGIAIILDGVFSHTGSDSIYFNKYGNCPSVGACQSADSPYYAWYQYGTNNLEYQCWWGIDSLPAVDKMNPSYRRFIYGSEDSVLSKWLNLGVAGWRLDVADELPDEFIQELRQAMKRIRSNGVLIGEVWEDASNKISYNQQRRYFLGDELDSTMNYPLRDSLLRFFLGESDSRTVHQEIMSLYENYPRENFYACMNLLGSHDTIRILTLLGDAPPEQSLTKAEQRGFRLLPSARQLAAQRLKLFSLVQMTFPGVPCLYYGDEAGVEGYADPYNRGTYPWGQEDQEILSWYRRVLHLRAEYEVLQTGDFKSFYFEPDVYGFTRESEEEEIVVLVNRHLSSSKTINLALVLQSSSFVLDLIKGLRLPQESLQSLQIEALSGRVLLRKKSLPNSLQLQRSSGVLLHITSLPSPWGQGDLGKEAYEFVDFLVDAGQSLWQVLPWNPAGVEDCPYQSESVFAGNPMFISLDHLIREGLLSLEEVREKYEQVGILTTGRSISSAVSKTLKSDLLRKAYQRFIPEPETSSNGPSVSSKSTYRSLENYLQFKTKNKEWLDDYVLFRALKIHCGDVPWYDWEPEIALREAEALIKYAELLQEEIGYSQFLQYTFFYEWNNLKIYAKAKGVQLVGDIPHFVAADSCDVWVNRGLFLLDEQGRPAKIAGVPPDYFSKTGQLWGNPIYNWEAQARTQYAWWKKRIQLGLELFDYIRLDHFRGFEAYWEVEAGEETAEKGRWIKGPGKRFFENLVETFGKCPFIVEDLGVITTEVNNLKQIFGFPGTKVLQFTPLEEILRESDTNFVYYSGTHDNNTLLGWYENNYWSEGESLISQEINRKSLSQQACRKLLEEIYLSPAVWVIVPMQDILGLGEEARMNVPGTVSGNWQWQLAKDLVTAEITLWLRTQTEKSKRSKGEKLSFTKVVENLQ